MWPDRVSNPGPPTYESGALQTALRGPTGPGECLSLDVNNSDVWSKDYNNLS